MKREAEYYVRPADKRHPGIDSGITLAQQCKSWSSVSIADDIYLGHLIQVGVGVGADIFGGPSLQLIAYDGDTFRVLATYGWWWNAVGDSRLLGWLHHHSGLLLLPRAEVKVT